MSKRNISLTNELQNETFVQAIDVVNPNFHQPSTSESFQPARQDWTSEQEKIIDEHILYHKKI